MSKIHTLIQMQIKLKTKKHILLKRFKMWARFKIYNGEN